MWSFFGELRTFIGWKIHQGPEGLMVSQVRYIEGLLKKHGMESCNANLTPLASEADLRPDIENEKALERSEHKPFQIKIGELLYLAVCTRPDISFAVCALARSLHTPTDRHRIMLRRILRYHSATKLLGLKFLKTESDLGVTAYSDSDWAGCKIGDNSPLALSWQLTEYPAAGKTSESPSLRFRPQSPSTLLSLHQLKN